jgi:hypothetical protein
MRLVTTRRPLLKETVMINQIRTATLLAFIAVVPILAATLAGTKGHAKQTSTPTRVADELKSLELEWHRALERTDTATLEHLLARDWFITNGSGQMIPKAELMQGLRSGDIRFVSTTPTEITVHVYGDAAVVTKRSTDITMYGTTPGGGTYQMTDMFVKVDDHWQCVATHASKDLKPH